MFKCLHCITDCLYFLLSAEFNCSIAIENITNNYDKLTIVPVKSILVKLISKRVVSIEQKQRINALLCNSEKVEYILDEVIIPELRSGKAKKFKGFLEAMEESDELPIVVLAKKNLGMLIYITHN